MFSETGGDPQHVCAAGVVVVRPEHNLATTQTPKDLGGRCCGGTGDSPHCKPASVVQSLCGLLALGHDDTLAGARGEEVRAEQGEILGPQTAQAAAAVWACPPHFLARSIAAANVDSDEMIVRMAHLVPDLWPARASRWSLPVVFWPEAAHTEGLNHGFL
jgi:hypothetical protein